MSAAPEKTPPLAVVGAQISYDEELFGKAFDRWVIGRFWVYMKPYKRRLLIAVLGVLAFTFTQLAIPLIVRWAIDDAVSTGTDALNLLHVAVIAFFGIITMNYIANQVQESIVGRVAGHLLFDLRRAMYAHLQIVSLSFMDRTEVGRLMSRLQGDVYALQEFLESSIFAIGDLVLLLGIVVVLLSLDVRLGALTLSVVPVLLIVRIVWLPLARKAFLWARETSSAANAALAESVHGIRAIQELGREDVNLDLFEAKAQENLQAHLAASKFTNMMIPIVDTLTGLALAIVVVVGGGLVLNADLDIGVMVAFLFYVQRFFDPIRSLTIQYSIMQRAMAAGHRIFEVMDVVVDIKDKPGAVDVEGSDGSVEFDHVTFGYVKDQPVLKDVSFRVEDGETVALVGPTGSGKTSAMALAHRFYDIWDGSIRVGGHDVRDITQDSLGRHVAMVLQEPFLFTGTVFENIRYNKTDATRHDVIAAAQAVGAHDFIVSLADGYDTEMEQGGTTLSVGQRQLLSFARALVADARILVLDEATANVDSYTELKIQQALARLLEGRTAMVIAHRLATIRGADRIIVLQDGVVIETGNHDELMELGGLYSRLYRMNYASFDDIPEDEIAKLTKAEGET
ncbi:MAG: ABC transporter ATP-binding protein [Rhodospirillaceae bacterium]|jgi:ATP-binding cassette, subfamily B, multidrug efflux pump|nr:ABC transporter ATP-binding protein [Rhodospirillaceae bacterium]MBT6509945.1 ABC transporter ATP-binding protein [Rhodospirillaceae bacterium]MBT7646687.1 ABC transporter ATP-binding protein [Rhodospirillaceae bacterium]